MSMRRPYPADPSASTSNSRMNGTQSHEMIESQNDQMVETMASKVKQLKSVSIDIGNEVRGQNTMLGHMGEDFDNTGGLLGASMKRVKGLGKAGHNRWMLYMIIFIVLVFLVCYYIIRWRRG